MKMPNTHEWLFTDAGFMPAVKEYSKRIRLTETVDSLVDSKIELSQGDAVLAMVLDTLAERSPLYRMKDSFKDKDVELLTGKRIGPELFDDTNLGRAI